MKRLSWETRRSIRLVAAMAVPIVLGLALLAAVSNSGRVVGTVTLDNGTQCELVQYWGSAPQLRCPLAPSE